MLYVIAPFIVILIILLPFLLGIIFIIKLIRDNNKNDCSNCPYRNNDTYYHKNG